MKEIYLDLEDLNRLKRDKVVYKACGKRSLSNGKYLIKHTNIVINLEDAEPLAKSAFLFKLMATDNGCVIKISYYGRLVKPKKVK